ncbi:hypothetical protein [Xanthomonas graminis]|nr:hypothetical protein [Xanthomonas translucens]WIH10249.1 hypothetical protein KM579_10070 [Xanthomonas translucens pv. graminis]
MKNLAALTVLLTGATAAAGADSFTENELNPSAIVLDGSYRYELTELSCAKEERVQNASDSARPSAFGRWLSQHVINHPKTKSFTRFTGSAYDGGGCYERTAKGIRVYRPDTAAAELTATVLPCRAELTQSGTCAGPEALPLMTPHRWTPSPISSEKLIGTLMSQPYARSAEHFLFENQPA